MNAYEIVAILRGDIRHQDLEIMVAVEPDKMKEKTYFKILGVTNFIDKSASVDSLTAALRPSLEGLVEKTK